MSNNNHEAQRAQFSVNNLLVKVAVNILTEMVQLTEVFQMHLDEAQRLQNRVEATKDISEQNELLPKLLEKTIMLEHLRNDLTTKRNALTRLKNEELAI